MMQLLVVVVVVLVALSSVVEAQILRTETIPFAVNDKSFDITISGVKPLEDALKISKEVCLYLGYEEAGQTCTNQVNQAIWAILNKVRRNVDGYKFPLVFSETDVLILTIDPKIDTINSVASLTCQNLNIEGLNVEACTKEVTDNLTRKLAISIAAEREQQLQESLSRITSLKTEVIPFVANDQTFDISISGRRPVADAELVSRKICNALGFAEAANDACVSPIFRRVIEILNTVRVSNGAIRFPLVIDENNR